MNIQINVEELIYKLATKRTDIRTAPHLSNLLITHSFLTNK